MQYFRNGDTVSHGEGIVTERISRRFKSKERRKGKKKKSSKSHRSVSRVKFFPSFLFPAVINYREIAENKQRIAPTIYLDTVTANGPNVSTGRNTTHRQQTPRRILFSERSGRVESRLEVLRFALERIITIYYRLCLPIFGPVTWIIIGRIKERRKKKKEKKWSLYGIDDPCFSEDRYSNDLRLY